MPKASGRQQRNSRISHRRAHQQRGDRRCAGTEDRQCRLQILGPSLQCEHDGAPAGAESFTDHIARSERRLVVTITSGMGSLADNTSGGSIAYRSSKAAVNMVMRSAAIDLAPRGIICVLVNPGWVRTDMGGPKAPLSPAGERDGHAAAHRDLRPKSIGQVLQLRRSRISVVNGAPRSLKPQNGFDSQITPTPSDAMRTSLREKSNRSPLCRNGNWKIASRDRRKPAHRTDMPEICPPETEARRPNPRRYRRLSPTGKNQARDRTAREFAACCRELPAG